MGTNQSVKKLKKIKFAESQISIFAPRYDIRDFKKSDRLYAS